MKGHSCPTERDEWFKQPFIPGNGRKEKKKIGSVIPDTGAANPLEHDQREGKLFQKSLSLDFQSCSNFLS